MFRLYLSISMIYNTMDRFCTEKGILFTCLSNTMEADKMEKVKEMVDYFVWLNQAMDT
jgi:hypothetical protein